MSDANDRGFFVHLSNARGAIAALIAAATIGAVASVWFIQKRLDAVERRQVWIICSTVPPHRNDVLSALEVECQFDPPNRDRRSIQGVPLLDEEDRRGGR